jgi:hypothetical protein
MMNIQDEQDDDEKRAQGLDRLGQRLSLEREERNIVLLERQSQIPPGARDQPYGQTYKDSQSTVTDLDEITAISRVRQETNLRWDSSEDVTYAPPTHRYVQQPKRTRRHREDRGLNTSSKDDVSFYIT